MLFINKISKMICGKNDFLIILLVKIIVIQVIKKKKKAK